ncbi:hypothetical protein SLEP1_g41586 [Rubroshorea leprosula]|uniref:Alpha-1,4 glucan phosphorylase n=1 Tax=Rubroshorea leprosula TaxID=152421 RepID=A0AAV5L7G1_9ROSI|nr:hypothetical protein SLEP1_g41586 [Rubroshorea leprosula]
MILALIPIFKISANVPATANPLAEEPSEIASNINYHGLYSPHFSPFKFESEQAYYATTDSGGDRLIKQWNETYLHFHNVNPKQAYYLPMEYLQGRALTNAVGNLNIQDAYADALKKLGHELENIVEQEKDAALGNGGLGRLASCFLDSMATLNLPAWGYGLRYKYGLFKQHITREGQEEIAEDWLEVQHDVVFPVRFFGRVEVNPNGSQKWVGGEVVQALAYDVPIPGYKTKNTISLRLWEAKACAEDFNLFEFNDGQYESAAQLHSQAQQLEAYSAVIMHPGFVLFYILEMLLKMGSFYVAVQLNDTHPTLAIPELMRLLMDDEDLGWDEAWDVTTRTIAYTNHTVLLEALEKWSQAVMWKLLPRHMEIIEEIDKRFIAMIRASHPDLENKLASMQVMDNNPQKPVVRMANLCVVSSQTVNGVAQLHSDILKSELFADYVSIWPTKFQNKTNGITPRRWLRFCNPELSTIMNHYQMVKTDKWVTNLDLLTGLRQLCLKSLVSRFSDNEELQTEWASAKMANKRRLAQYVLQVTGTLDGANVEIREEIGEENFFLFGAKADEVPGLRKERENGLFKPDRRFEEAKAYIRSGVFGTYDYNPLLESLEGNSGYGRGDYFLVGHDFPSYMDAQARVDEAYK